jgi:hypothetical protein
MYLLQKHNTLIFPGREIQNEEFGIISTPEDFLTNFINIMPPRK